MSGMPELDAAASADGRTLALHLRALMRQKGDTGIAPPQLARDARDPLTGKTMAPPTAYSITNPNTKPAYYAPEFLRGMASEFGVEHAELYIPMCVDMGLDPPKVSVFASMVPKTIDQWPEKDRMMVLDIIKRIDQANGFTN